ncbi:hypothetical protein EI94DRAFT_1737154, partial [Lactarius quietus]
MCHQGGSNMLFTARGWKSSFGHSGAFLFWNVTGCGKLATHVDMSSSYSVAPSQLEPFYIYSVMFLSFFLLSSRAASIWLSQVRSGDTLWNCKA